MDAEQQRDPQQDIAEQGDTQPLAEDWTIWFDKQAKRKTKGGRTIYEDCIVELGSFNTTQGFWAYWHSLQVQNLKEHCNLRIFKKGIKPLWEDPLNVDGGKWVVRGVSSQHRRQLWTAMVTALIAGELRDSSDHTVCGAVLSTREGGDSMQLWVDGGAAARDAGTTQHILAQRAGWGSMGALLGGRFFPEQEHRFIYQTHRELQSHQQRGSNSAQQQQQPAVAPAVQSPPQQPASPQLQAPPVATPPPPPPPAQHPQPHAPPMMYTASPHAAPGVPVAATGIPLPAAAPSPLPVGVGVPVGGVMPPLPVPLPLAQQQADGVFLQPGYPPQPTALMHQMNGMNPAAAPYAPQMGAMMLHPQYVVAPAGIPGVMGPAGVGDDDDDDGELQDPGADAPPAIRAIHERAKQVRTLRKKVRYINFFLTRQSRGRDLTPQEKGRVRSLPFLQRELQLLEEEQVRAVEAQKQELGMDSVDFMRKRQQPMTYATEEERRFKTTRAIRKKIRFIHYHLERQREGKTLSPAELAKVQSLPELEARLADLEAEEAAAQADRPPEEQPAGGGDAADPIGAAGADGDAAQHQIATLQAQVDAQRAELEEKQRHIETLQRARAPSGPRQRTPTRGGAVPLSPGAVAPAAYGGAVAAGHIADPYSPGGGGPPVLESPPLSPPLSPGQMPCDMQPVYPCDPGSHPCSPGCNSPGGVSSPGQVAS